MALHRFEIQYTLSIRVFFFPSGWRVRGWFRVSIWFLPLLAKTHPHALNIWRRTDLLRFEKAALPNVYFWRYTGYFSVFFRKTPGLCSFRKWIIMHLQRSDLCRWIIVNPQPKCETGCRWIRRAEFFCDLRALQINYSQCFFSKSGKHGGQKSERLCRCIGQNPGPVSTQVFRERFASHWKTVHLGSAFLVLCVLILSVVQRSIFRKKL